MPRMQASLSKIKDYPKFLNDHWPLHLMPRAKDAPTFISLFAGCGGSSLGYSFAGFRELLAVEWDQNAVDTFKLNFSDVPVYRGDIAELSVDECLELTGLQVGELDVLDGSPPCQGFSTAGRRIMQDARNFLFREYVRLLEGLQPKVFVMENVSGMVKGKMKLIFAEILRELKAVGYKVKAVLMNAMYFGVPQSRQRMVFVGTRNDLEAVRVYPQAIYQPIVVQDGILGCSAEPRMAHSERIESYWSQLKEGQCVADKDSKGNGFGAVKVDRSKPCPTLTKGWTAGTGLMHFADSRFLSDSELKRIGGFPDAFQFIGTSVNIIQQIGNSVPPPFMKAIAEHIRTDIFAKGWQPLSLN